MAHRKSVEKELDIGWSYGRMVDNNHRHVQCNYCQKKMHGGITRLKEHLAGIGSDVALCREVPKEVKEKIKAYLLGKKQEKQAANLEKQRIHEELMRKPQYLDSDENSEEDEDQAELRRGMRASRQYMEDGGLGEGSRLPSRSKSYRVQEEGSKFPSRSRSVHIQREVDFGTRNLPTIDSFMQKKGGKSQSSIKTAMKGIKDAKKHIGRAISKFFFYNHIPHNVASNPYYETMIDAITDAGHGVKPPTTWEISNTYLDAEYKEIEEYMKQHEKYWDEYGCTLMCDGWSTQNRRKIINFLVYSTFGTVFIDSIDATDEFQSAEYICSLMNDMVERIGEKRVVQVVTDNGANYKAAGYLLMETRKHLYWTPCAAHCIDLMLEDMAKEEEVKNAIQQCQKITGYIYNHGWLLSMMKKETGQKELIRPAITRFATHFIALDSIHIHRDDLKRMVVSREWINKFPKLSTKDRTTAFRVQTIIQNEAFWNDVASINVIFEPLVKVLRMVDSDDRAEMGYLYEAMDRAKESIRHSVGRGYRKWWNIIDKRWDKQLHRDIHAAGYFLNPAIQYSNNTANDNEVLSGFRHVIGRLEPDISKELDIDREVVFFRMKVGAFGSDKAKLASKQLNPAEWWSIIARETGKTSRTWILYNKPPEPNFTHAGLLLALGLHEHLCVLLITDVYRYLSEEHDITTVGVLLGMAASYRGTMHPAISKMLYLHIPYRHPSSFPELELPTILQSAALMAIGLLYEGSAHLLTMKILLGEIGRRSSGDNVLKREGYAVAAGCALGLVALGRGKEAFGSVDSFVDRLFHYTGGKEVYNEKSLAIGRIRDDHNRSTGQINVDVTAPGAIISLALIFLKTESEVIASRIYIPATHFDLQYVRPDFIMLRIIARNLIMWNRVCPSRDWVESQIPEFVKVSVLKIGDAASDSDDFDSEALVQAYVNVVAGACISLGLKYAGTKNGDAQELLYNYAIYFLNEIKHVSAASKNDLPKGLSDFVDRGTLEICLHLIVLSLSVVMAGSGHLQTFRLLRYLRGRSSAEGNINYGIQMAVSLAIGFLFLGGGTQTFSTGNSAIAALLITLYPRFPTGPNDNRCHLQAFRHLYVIAAESRRLQTVDVDTGLPVYAPIEMTIKETDHYSETSFCEVTPCILPERSVLKSVRVCGPRYWPQVIHLVPEDKPWWRSGDKNDPFNGGLLYIRRKVGSCSYMDDPVGCQSLLSRAMHKIFDTSSSYNSAPRFGNSSDLGLFNVEQLVSAFSADPSLIAFSQLCCGSTWNSRSDSSFQDFCSQVLFECISKDRPALLQVYLSLYTIIGSMWEQVNSSQIVFYDSCFLSSLKLALAYNEALMSGKLTWAKGGIIQSTFLESIRKHLEEILERSLKLKGDLYNYLKFGEWPNGELVDSMLLAWYLQWYSVPPTHVVKSASEKIKGKVTSASSVVPLLHLLLPNTHIRALTEIDKFLCFPKC